MEMGFPDDLKDLRQLMPLPDGFEERIELAFEAGLLRVYHADPYCTALAKLERLRASAGLEVGWGNSFEDAF